MSITAIPIEIKIITLLVQDKLALKEYDK